LLKRLKKDEMSSRVRIVVVRDPIEPSSPQRTAHWPLLMAAQARGWDRFLGRPQKHLGCATASHGGVWPAEVLTIQDRVSARRDPRRQDWVNSTDSDAQGSDFDTEYI